MDLIDPGTTEGCMSVGGASALGDMGLSEGVTVNKK